MKENLEHTDGESLSRESFIIYRSYWEGLRRMDKDVQLELYNAIMEYGFTGNTPAMSDTSMGIFILMKPNIDVSLMRYRNGRKGGKASAAKNGTAKNAATASAQQKQKCASFADEIAEMLANKQWSEPVCMQFAITQDDLERRLADFATHLKTTMDTAAHDSLGDAHRHFLSWMRKKYPAETKEPPQPAPDYDYNGGFGGEDT